MEFIQKHRIFSLFEPFLSVSSSRCVNADYYPKNILDKNKSINVLDLGCGVGNSIDLFKDISPHINWFGVDVENSPEGKLCKITDGNFSTYNGVNLPYDDNFFDFVYSSQVLEHVRYPDALLKDVFRVLKPGGYLAGSVAYLIPYHSLSIYNFTPYGLIVSFKDAGFELKEMKAGLDCMVSIIRHMLNAPKFLEPFYAKISPFNILVNIVGVLFRLSHKEMNFLKLQFAGLICFLAQKPGHANS
jgi:ubiquinone/menaquinone biosynthesis C-methylase UbiE